MTKRELFAAIGLCALLVAVLVAFARDRGRSDGIGPGPSEGKEPPPEKLEGTMDRTASRSTRRSAPEMSPPPAAASALSRAPVPGRDNPLPGLRIESGGVCRYRHEGDHFSLVFILPQAKGLARREVKTWGIRRGEDPLMLERSAFSSETMDPVVFLHDSDFPLYDGFAVTASGLPEQAGLLLATIWAMDELNSEDRPDEPDSATGITSWSQVDECGDLVERTIRLDPEDPIVLNSSGSLLSWRTP